MSDTGKISKASDDLLTLSEEMRRLAVELRDCAPLGDLSYAYSRVYFLRRDLGRVVATLGVGLPRKSTFQGRGGR